MQTKSLILAACTLLLFQWSFSQAICGFDAIHQKKMKEDPIYRKNVLAGEASILKYIRAHPVLKLSPSKITKDKLGIPKQGVNPSILGTALYTIPVVVHVVHTGGPVGSIYNPNDARILGAIDYLNAVYNGSYPGTQGVGDLQIQFVLAQRDPNCNPTNGIIRVDGSGISGYASDGVQWGQNTTGTAVINVKNLTRWDPTQYYNIWVVDKINGNDGTSGSFVAGFAFFPGAAANDDGTVMLATQMLTGQKTLPHEIGHAFNLYHPFEGSADSTSCPLNTNNDCTLDGDLVCDTDPISYHFSAAGGVNFNCRTGNSNPCAGGAPYTISTESNYMNYSNCYTLFTAGQKARMLASAAGPYRSTLSSSLGGTAPGAGSSPCVPKINFEMIGDQKTEATAATSGCRSYTDYAYNMIIGVSPTAAATATLSVNSGTALMGRDFDFTTNGSFSSPGNTLAFPAGSVTSQPFTIRIYDDASVNGTRNFVLGFTVNSGGGNAIAGNGRPNFTMIINDNDVAPASGTSTGIVALGTVSNSFNQTPFDARQQSQRVQFLYKASELTTAGVPAGSLSGISLFISSKLSTRSYTNLNINIGKAGVNYLVNNSLVTLGSSMTLVKTLASCNTVAGWNNFNFDTPYTWDGTSNLVIEICYDNGTTAPADAGDVSSFYSDGGSSVQGNLFFQNGVNCSQSFTTATYIPNGIKPIIKLFYGIPGTAIETIVNSSQQQYLGPNTDVYFYDQVNNQLMARIQNPGAHDYGCTQVIVDRAGSATAAFWNNNTANYLLDKAFRVLPTTNNASGSYTITLYYTQAEIAAWQTATGQILSNIQLIKVANRISDVTPTTPTGGGSFVIATPTIGSLGANTSLTYNFTTGFSGFGAGVPGTAVLPIGLLDFKGSLKENNVVLDWSTSFEAGSKGFEIHRSYDGNTFTAIGYVAAAGNSFATRSYSFKDPSIAQDKNYYRLKQTDRDGKFIYSKIILIEDPHTTDKAFTVLTNPFTASLDIAFSRTVTGKVQVRLMDITGKEILRQSGEQTGLSRMRIDLSGKPLSSGIYLLEVWYNNERHVARVIKN